MNWLLQLGGTGLILITTVDIFLTVLFPRTGNSLIGLPLSRGTWRLFRWTSRRFTEGQRILTYCGPTLIVAVAVAWIILFVTGFALVIWPALGDEIVASQDNTPTDLATAFYYSAYTFTTLGVGDLVPKTGFYRLLTILEATLGFSTFTLTLTYFLSVYSALTQRNTFALGLEHRTAGEGNAAAMITRLGAGGSFDSACSDVSNMAHSLLHLLESHHAYPVLHYFRFLEPYYSFARMAFINLDTATLARTALEPHKYHAFIHSTAMTQLESGSLHALFRLADSFLHGNVSSPPPDQEQRWRQWYYQAVEKIQLEGIATNPDLDAGADRYVAMRRQWNGKVAAFAQYMSYRWSDIAPGES